MVRIRFLVGILVACSALLLSLQVFVSLEPATVSATSHSMNITAPAAGSWQNSNFQVQYNALNASVCEIEINDGGAGWQNRGPISCGANQNATIQVGPSGWCSTEGQDQCGVRITASPTPVITTATFSYTGGPQTWLVPGGVTDIEVELWGAQGGNSPSAPPDNGEGGYVKTKLSVSPGETLNVFVGGKNGFNGGGEGGGEWSFLTSKGYVGGGASDIRIGGIGLANRVVVAGAGGGAGYAPWVAYIPDDGGKGGGVIGGDGPTYSNPCASPPDQLAEGGKGGTQIAGGEGGLADPYRKSLTYKGQSYVEDGKKGSLGQGGEGGRGGVPSSPLKIWDGVAGIGSGGGGGGYYGGGGGAGVVRCNALTFVYGSRGGGGGSSWVDPAREVGSTTHTQGARVGNGEVKIHYADPSAATSATDERNFSIDYTPPAASFDIPPTPPDGSDQAENFPIQYNTADNIQFANCVLSSSSDGGSTWTPRKSGLSACGVDQTDTGLIPGWCTPGAKCAIRIQAEDLAGNIAEQILSYNAAFTGGLVPCGRDTNDPVTDWDESKPCELSHTFLLIWVLVNFALWKAVPLIIVLLTILTGVIFYFSFGGPDTLARARGIWRAVLMGTLLLLFSWLFLNFFLGILGFNINIFGRWYEITL